MFTRKIYTLIGILCLYGANIYAQELKLTGKILDSENNQPLPFTNLFIENTNHTSTTNDKGIFYFNINKRIELPLYLKISYIGYEKQRIEITKSDSSITIYLQPKGVALNEISVFAKQIFMTSKEAISSNTLSSSQVRSLSGLTKDPFRSIQLLPGVSSNNETTAKYNVRGGNYDENLVLINGIEIYNPFHIKEAPMASVGIFNIDMVKSINFSAGGFNAEYGNALSSLLNIEYESGHQESFAGKFDFNFLDMSLLAKGPIGERAGYNIGLRRCNLNYLIKAGNVKPEIDMIYYDYQTQFDFQFDDYNKLKLNIIYSGDDYDQKPFVEVFTGRSFKLIKGVPDLVTSSFYRNQPFIAKYRNLMVGLISENKLSSILASKIYFSIYNEIEDENLIYNDETRYTFRDNSNLWEKITSTGNKLNQLNTRTISYKHDLLLKLSQSLSLKGGFNYKSFQYDYHAITDIDRVSSSNVHKYPEVTVSTVANASSPTDSINIILPSHRLEGYLQGSFQAANRFTINSGIRADYFDINKQTKFSPRVNLLYVGPFEINFRAGWGVFYQPPTFIQLRLYESSVDNTGYQKATHYIFGLDKNISEHLTISTEFYYKKYDDFIPAIKAHNGKISYGDKLNNATGFAKGIDVQLMLNFERFYFWASYGYLVAREKLTTSDEGYYPRLTDQTHTLSAVLGVDLGKKWEVTLKGFYGSGYTYTPSNIIWDEQTNLFKWISGSKNSAHFPAYERVDLTIGKSFELFSNPLNIYFDIMNVLNKKNVLNIGYTFDSSGNPMQKEDKLFSVVPMIGIKYNF